MDQEQQFKKYPLWQIILFLQPLKSLLYYNRSNNHTAYMQLADVNYNLLPKLSKDQFKDELDVDKLMINSENQNKSFMRIVFKTFRSQLLYYIMVLQLCAFIKMAVSYLLGYTLKMLGQAPVAGCILFSTLLILQVLIEQHYFQNIYQLSVKIRYTIVAMLYKRVLLYKLKDYSKGQFINILQMDLCEIDSGLTWFLAYSGSFVVAVLGIVLLYSYFGYRCIFGVITLILINLLQRKIINYSVEFKNRKNVIQDERTRLSEEVIENLRILKFYGVEQVYRNELLKKREEQDKETMKIMSLDSLSQCIGGNISVFLALIVMIIGYDDISIDKIFGSLWVLQLIKVWCITYFYRGYKFITNMIILQERIQQVINLSLGTIQQKQSKQVITEEKKGQIQMVEEEDSAIKSEQSPYESNLIRVTLNNYHAGWEIDKSCLEDICINITSGQLVTVIGKVGSSKSSLLLAIMNELPYYVGQNDTSGKIAYVEQDPYIFGGTIKDNILFGNQFDPQLYEKVLSRSGLQNEIDDMREVGDKGVNISGGQRVRLSLARAMYSKADIFLLDDLMSSLDSKVSKQVFQNGILELRKENKIVVLVSNESEWGYYSDYVILMNEGRIMNEARGVTAIKYLIDWYLNEQQQQEQKKQEQQEEQQEECNKLVLSDKVEEQEQQDTIPANIPFGIYKRYVEEGGGYKQLLIIVVIYLCDAILNLVISKQFGYLTQDSNRLYPLIVIILVYLLNNFIKLELLFIKSLLIIQSMHRKLASSVLKCSLDYLNHINIGQLLARFTSDLNNIEILVILDCHWVLEGIIDNLFIILIVSYQNIYILMTSLIILCLMFYFKSKFHNLMKYAIKSDDITRSQFNKFLQTSINSQILIRIYNQEGRHYGQLMQLIYNNMQAYFTFLRLNALIAFVIELALNLIIIITLIILVIVINDPKNQIDTAFSLLILLQLGYIFSLNLRGQIYLDIDIQNAYRVFQTIDIPTEDIQIYDQILSVWPRTGEIVYSNVANYALNSVSFKIKSNQSIAIVGQTGAGKTTLISALFRMVEYRGDIVIDGMNIKQIDLQTLRSKLQIIPQQAPIIQVSIRFNLDPYNQFSDEDIWSALNKVHLAEKIKSTPLQLNTICDKGYFSQGQTQLLSLARILLTANGNTHQIIVFDEATSNLDHNTSQLIFQILNHDLANTTRLFIAHKLTTITQCDRVIVLNKGQLIEYDTIQNLMQKDTKYGLKELVESSQEKDKFYKLIQ